MGKKGGGNQLFNYHIQLYLYSVRLNVIEFKVQILYHLPKN